jgi:hypothetical protein
MDPILVGILSAIAGYVGGHLHYKIGNSSCLYGLCSVSNVDLEMDNREKTEKTENKM